jgi:hypothetical protein
MNHTVTISTPILRTNTQLNGTETFLIVIVILAVFSPLLAYIFYPDYRFVNMSVVLAWFSFLVFNIIILTKEHRTGLWIYQLIINIACLYTALYGFVNITMFLWTFIGNCVFYVLMTIIGCCISRAKLFDVCEFN